MRSFYNLIMSSSLIHSLYKIPLGVLSECLLTCIYSFALETLALCGKMRLSLVPITRYSFAHIQNLKNLEKVRGNIVLAYTNWWRQLHVHSALKWPEAVYIWEPWS